MEFKVGSKIIVEHPSDEIYKWCYENFVLENPEYHKRMNMGLWCGNTPREFALYEKVGNKLFLPYGAISKVKNRYGDKCPIWSLISPIRRVNYQSNIKPYTYQEKAIQEALRAFHGVVVMPCGSGKTQTALEIISRIGGRCLWLTHTQDLLNQSFDRARSVLDIALPTYGKITGGKVNIGSGITFATVQTMAKLDLQQYRDAWDIVVVDECHRAIGSPTRVMQFYKVLSNVSCKYKFGLTATPSRADGLEDSMFALLGDVVCEIDKKEVESTTCPVSVEFYETDYMPNLSVVLSGDGTINYSSLVSDMIKDEARFNLVSEVIAEKKSRGAMLVLGNRVEYVKKLSEAFDGNCLCLSGMGNSKAAKAERKEALRRLNEGELDCVFATYQLAKEGLDVPNLRTVVLATPEKDETTVIQATGRVSRKFDGKDCGLVVDIVDEFGMYAGWAKKRKKYYKKSNYAF